MNRCRYDRLVGPQGFTLLEVLFVLVIVAFLTVITLERWDELVEEHRIRAVSACVAELNARETMVWAQTLVSTGHWPGDEFLFSKLDNDLGRDFHWAKSGPLIQGGRIVFQGHIAVALERLPSTAQTPGRWRVHEP
ncbi:type II secretion system protein [Desulfatiferula olefinivorans]